MNIRIALSISQTSCVGLIGVFACLVSLNNILDYQSNFEFVRHVLSMDTTFEGNKLMNRAIETSYLHHIAYAVIIFLEASIGLINLVAAGLMISAIRTSDSMRFSRAKGCCDHWPNYRFYSVVWWLYDCWRGVVFNVAIPIMEWSNRCLSIFLNHLRQSYFS